LAVTVIEQLLYRVKVTVNGFQLPVT
jgi:hypothetical protein